MSYRVLVIPEDPTHNGYILRPLTRALLADAGKTTARIEILVNPKLNGYDDALRAIREDLPRRYGWFDLWLFFPDADRASPAAMRALEQEVANQGIRLLCCPAEPELEVYACAGYQAGLGRPWSDVRQSTNLKEALFATLLARYGDDRRAGGGRDLMIAEALRSLPQLFRLCPELAQLRERIAQAAQAH